MTVLLWFAGSVVVLGIALWLRRRAPGDESLGSVSGAWLDNHRRETHRDD